MSRFALIAAECADHDVTRMAELLGGSTWVLGVAVDDDVGVIGVDDDVLMRMPRSPVASGALVFSVTGCSPR